MQRSYKRVATCLATRLTAMSDGIVSEAQDKQRC